MIFQFIESYLTGESTAPLVVHGESGCGKTSIVAMAAKVAQKVFTDQVTIVR